MTPLASQQAADVMSICLANAAEAAQALSRALDVEVALEPVGTHALSLQAPPGSLAGPGLALVWQTAEFGVVALLSEIGGVLPRWYSEPDATGRAKLATLAQELGMLLLPEEFAPSTFSARHVTQAAAALVLAEVADERSHVELAVTAGQHRSALHLVWPVARVEAILSPEPAPPGITPGRVPLSAARSAGAYERPEAMARPPARRGRTADLEELPSYTRSLLKISVPVRVVLAKQRQRLDLVTELAPGSILQFNKPCDDLLELEIGDRTIAQGEAIKVGDKFGLRISTIVLPDERFRGVSVQRPSGA
jgi:flagellar motor switch protein FliN